MPLKGNIFVTGGTGTLACALLRTALVERWDAEFTMFSRSELRQSQMRAKFPNVRYVLGDIRDYDRLVAAIAGHSTVLHFAAMKRLPECEQYPTECIATNVLGSQNVARAAIVNRVERCIATSTDKACAAITCYGASKKIMESIWQGQVDTSTTFTLVRYGNVVASNGSVIPLWREQAARGQALTITDRRMTRFWMSERDAVATIEQALHTPAGSIYVPRMGALGIEQMAHIIAPGCELVETGLRSTEKLHEDLVHPYEGAVEQARGFLLCAGAPGGIAYTSAVAPRLSPGQFTQMLREAEDD